MGTVRLGLELPSTHDMFFDYNGDSFSHPICGSVILTAHTEAELLGLSRLQVSLVLLLSISNRDGIKEHEPFSSRISRLLSLSPQLHPAHMTRHCSLIEEVALCVPTVLSDIHVGYSPDKGNIHKIPFLIPIPAGIPETTVTDLGQLSLYLVASTTTAAEEAIGASEQINIVRRIIPGSDPIQHTRIYPTSKVINDVILTQKLGASTGSRLSLSVRVSLRKPAAPSNRALEFKCVAIRKIQWRVEEVTKLFKSAKDYRQPRNEEPPEYEPVEDESFTRELFHGYQNGYWGTPDNPIVKEQETHQEKNSAVEIAFDIAIPRAVAPTPEIGLKCYSFDYRPGDHLLPCVHEDTSSMTQQRMMITVEHRLKLDILTSEDTFGVHNKSLVDRKPLQTALSGSFPLHILKKSQNNIDPDVWQVNPPCYTEIPASPPHYEPIF